MIDDSSDKDEDKIVDMEEYEHLRNITDEDRKKRREKDRARYERRQHNESVLRNYKLGKYKNK